MKKCTENSFKKTTEFIDVRSIPEQNNYIF